MELGVHPTQLQVRKPGARGRTSSPAMSITKDPGLRLAFRQKLGLVIILVCIYKYLNAKNLLYRTSVFTSDPCPWLLS